MRQDFENLNKNIKIGTIIMVVLSATIMLLSLKIYKLTKHTLSLYETIEVKNKEIVRINKVSYERFVIASDLTEICNRFQSSRNAKLKYYLNK